MRKVTTFSWSWVLLAFLGCLALDDLVPLASAEASEQDISDTHRTAVDPWAALPDSALLSSYVMDDEGNPIRGATISIGGKQKAKTDRTGAFTLEDPVTPETLLLIKHPRLARRIIRAGELMSAEGAALPVHLVPYTSSFNVTPSGGTYKSGELTLEVPPGAVTSRVQILAAVLPLDFAYNNNGEVEPLRLSAVDLKPHGLKFRKPVTLSMTIAREDISEISEPKAFYFDEKKNVHTEDEGAEIEIEDHRISVTMTHFSTHSTADGKAARSVMELGRGSDRDGDGRITPSDAYFMLMGSGGTHEATGSYTQSVSGTVMKETEKSTGSSKSESASASAGFDFKGANFGVSGALSRSEAMSVVNRFSKSENWERTMGATLDVSVPEYAFECEMILGRHAYSRATEWERIAPSPTEQEAIENHWNSKKRTTKSGAYEYFDYEGPSDLVAGRTLSGHHKLAVRKGKDGLEVFRKKNGYVIAKLRNFTTEACPAGLGSSLPEATERAARGTGNKSDRQTALERKFRFGSASGEPSGNEPWGTLNPDQVAVFINRECGRAERQTWSYAIAYEATEEEGKNKDQSNTSESGHSTGGFGASISASKAKVRYTSKASRRSEQKTESITTSVDWQIVNAHGYHFSDHIVAWLQRQTPEGKVPFGFLMLRTAERSCGAQPTPSPTPGSRPPGSPTTTKPKPGPAAPTGPGGAQGGAPSPTNSPRHSDDPRSPGGEEPPIDVPADEDVPDGESTQDPGAPPDDRTTAEMERDAAADTYLKSLAAQSIDFTTLTGTILVNGEKTGTPVDVKAIGHSGNQINVSTETTGEHIVINVPKDKEPAAIAVKGPDGQMTLRSSLIPPKDFELPKVKPRPVDGMVDIANGFSQETFFVPQAIVDLDAPLRNYYAELGGTVVEAYAARSGEVAILGFGIVPSSDGETWMSIANPEGDTAAGTVEAWGYEIGAQPSTQVGTWAPVYFRCTGLDAQDRISISLTPRPWQTIEMFHETVSCGQASDFVIVAQYRTTRVGPQQFDATIKRLKAGD